MLEECVTGFVFAQMSAKKGRKKYNIAADRKLLEEFQQLLDYNTFTPRKYESLSEEAKKTAAGMFNIIEEKINRGHTDENPVLIKGRSCFDGRGQHCYMYTKEETASPRRQPNYEVPIYLPPKQTSTKAYKKLSPPPGFHSVYIQSSSRSAITIKPAIFYSR
jgi:hypothetical protein